MSYLTVINSAIDEFILDPYDEKYNIPFTNSLLELSDKELVGKQVSIYKTNLQEYKKNIDINLKCINVSHELGDIVFALVCDFDYYKLECKLIIDDIIINTFTVYPDKISFLFSGLPLILLNMPETKSIILKFYHNDIEIIPHSVEFYCANLENEIRKELGELVSKPLPIIGEIADNQFFKIEKGVEQIIKEINKYYFEPKELIT